MSAEPSKKCQQPLNNKRVQRVVPTSAIQSRKATMSGEAKAGPTATAQHNNTVAEARRRAAMWRAVVAKEENDSMEQTALVGSVVVASALAALSVFALLKVTRAN
jgi:hypothetical protein